jgi:hypothetical protein
VNTFKARRGVLGFKSSLKGNARVQEGSKVYKEALGRCALARKRLSMD